MAMTLKTLQAYCDPKKLRTYGSSQDVFLYDGVDPYRTLGITDQFLANAALYHERYFRPSPFGDWLQSAFATAELSPAARTELAVLDLGSGSGNTVVPLLSRNPTWKVVATDLSIDLLLILAALLKETDYGERIGFVCADANRKTFYDGVFDLVVGASILHHLMRPSEAVTRALACLRPGGAAIFIEPFEYGCNLMKNLYHQLLDDPRVESDLHPEVAAHFQAIIHDYNARFEPESPKPYTQDLDDKWLFTKRFFGQICARNGCRLIDITNIRAGALEEACTLQVLGNLQLTGLDRHTLPAWCLTLCRDYDRSLDLELKRQMLLEGTVIIRK
jgi:SAM-dependent methyltransferase